MEAGDPSVSLDLLIRTLLSAGATAQDIAETIQNTAVQPSSPGKELSKRF